MANRQLAILRLLRRGKTSTGEIATKTESCRRTVERDLLDLSLDYFIGSECGKYGGVWLERASIVGEDILTKAEVGYILQKLSEIENREDELRQAIIEKLSPLLGSEKVDGKSNDKKKD